MQLVLHASWGKSIFTLVDLQKKYSIMMLYLLACSLLATLAVVRGDICTSEETKTFTVSVDLFASELGTFVCGCC